MVKGAQIPAVKGFRDVLPDESAGWNVLEAEAIEIFSRYNFEEIRLPVAERTDLFARSIGEATDIVEKEMYTFTDRGDTSITLRPEATAGVVRAAIEHNLATRDNEIRLFYRGPMFRRERPQKGRFRQFYQIGVEVLGRDDPVIDAELLVLVDEILGRVGARTATIELNSLGDGDCRPAYRELLREFAADRREALCPNCQRRLARNPLRILDCKEAQCRAAMEAAPLMIDRLCGPCADHLAAVRRLLDAAGVPFVINPHIVRGLDYYCRTAFEITASGLGSQNALGGGGRYDDLVATLGGPAVTGVGFALGVERLLMVAEGLEEPRRAAGVFVAALSDAAWATGLAVATRLRRAGQRVELAGGGRRLRALMRYADRSGARHVLIIGAEELAAGRGTIRDMERKADHPLSVDLAAAGGDIVAQIARLTGAAA
jgi:histidyl-tRNA synthetase